VARGVGAVVAPITETAAGVASPVVGVVGSAVPLTRAVGAVVAPITETAAAVVAPVVRATRPVLEPVSAVAKELLSPVTKAAGPIVSALPVTGLVSALTSVVKPITGPASPGLNDILTPVADGVGRPVGAPVSDVVEAPAAGSVAWPATPLARTATTGPPPDQARTFAPAQEQTATSGRTCTAPTAPTAFTSAKPRKTAIHHATAGSHRPGDTPAQPGAPVSSSDAATSAGSGIPPAFLAAGHAPHHFRASPWTHGDFVPLWRPCKPGTGPG
jgi:hypothetical protein